MKSKSEFRITFKVDSKDSGSNANSTGSVKAFQTARVMMKYSQSEKAFEERLQKYFFLRHYGIAYSLCAASKLLVDIVSFAFSNRDKSSTFAAS